MPRKPSTHPTDVELAILQVIWDRGPSTVREVHEALEAERQVGYSTTLKMIQVMHAKGLLKRDDTVRPQRYRAVTSRSRTQRRMIDNLVEKAFGGAASQMLVQALSTKRLEADELAELKEVIERLEGESR